MKYVTYNASQRIAKITLNRPEKRNALNEDVVSELLQAFHRAEDDDDVKLVVLKAAGSVFCAGADLSYLQQLQNNSFKENLADSSHLKDLFYKIYTLKKVVIAQVHGHAIAGGCGLTTVCDFTFAVPEARFGYTEVRIGFIPAIVNVFLIRKIGEAKAKELLLSGNLIDAETAHQYGLVNRIVSAQSLEDEVDAFAHQLCVHNSGQSMAYTKKMIAKIQSMPLEEGLDFAAKMNAKARESVDCKKGIASFLNKEEIKW